MFKLVVLSVFFTVAFARPGHLHSSPVVYSTPIVEEHSFQKIGEIVKSVPTGETHHSSTIVHNVAHHVEPIIAPVVKTYAAAPIPQVVHTPIVETYEAADPWTLAEANHSGYEIAIPSESHSALEHAADW